MLRGYPLNNCSKRGAVIFFEREKWRVKNSTQIVEKNSSPFEEKTHKTFWVFTKKGCLGCQGCFLTHNVRDKSKECYLRTDSLGAGGGTILLRLSLALSLILSIKSS